MTRPDPRILGPADFSHAAYPPQFVSPIPEEHIYRVMEGDMLVPLVVQRALEDEEQREQSTPLSRAHKIAFTIMMGTVAWVLVAWALTYVAPDHFAAVLGWVRL